VDPVIPERLSFSPRLRACLLMLLCLWIAGCNGARTRPYGYIRLGAVSELAADEQLFPELRLLLRRDHMGFFVMSLMCPKDLYELRPREGGFDCPFCHSHFGGDGTRISGDAPVDLPYYRLDLDRGEYDGAANTLYAEVGREVGRSWRLQVPR